MTELVQIIDSQIYYIRKRLEETLSSWKMFPLFTRCYVYLLIRLNEFWKNASNYLLYLNISKLLKILKN